METEKEKIERYHRQLQLYAYIIEQKYNKSVSKMHLYYTAETEGIPTISFSNRASEMTKTMMAIDKTVQQIRCKNFKGRSTSEKLCQYCDIRYYCNKV
jgi:DNA helicase-2/ATP-dependent DNA helicase PcrA